MGKCFVPFFKSGYKSCKEKYAIFTPPANNVLDNVIRGCYFFY